MELYDNIMANIQDFKNVEILKLEIVVTKSEAEESLKHNLESYLSAAKFPSLTNVTYIPHSTNAITLGPATATAASTSNEQQQDEGTIIMEQDQDLANVKPKPKVTEFYGKVST